MKRIIALALSLALLLGLAAGCGQESGSETAMGRYIEEQGPVLENMYLAGGLRRPENRPVFTRVRQLFADTPDIFN